MHGFTYLYSEVLQGEGRLDWDRSTNICMACTMSTTICWKCMLGQQQEDTKIIQVEKAEMLPEFFLLKNCSRQLKLLATWCCQCPIPAGFQGQAGLHLARQEVSSPSFAHPCHDLGVDSPASIALAWQWPDLKVFILSLSWYIYCASCKLLL